MTQFSFRASGSRWKPVRAGALGAILFIAIASVLIASQANARPDIRQMTCGQVNATIRQSGAIVMSITNTRFARFVASTSYCDFNERARPTYEATVDAPRCQIRYICERHDPFFSRY